MSANVRDVARSMVWTPFLVTGILGLAAAAYFAVPTLDSTRLLTGSRILAILIALGASFAFDRQAIEFERPTPRSTRYTTGLRLLCSATAAGVICMVGTIVMHFVSEGRWSPLGLTVELVAFVSAGWAMGLDASRSIDSRLGGVVGSVSVLLIGAAAKLMPSRLPLYVSSPAESQWIPSRWRWAVLAIVIWTVSLLRQRADLHD